MPHYPGSSDPSDSSFAERRRLIEQAINSLEYRDQRHLLDLLQTTLVDKIDVSIIDRAFDEEDEEQYVCVYFSSDKGVVLYFYENDIDGPLFFVGGDGQVPEEFREMKNAVIYFVDMVDYRSKRF